MVCECVCATDGMTTPDLLFPGGARPAMLAIPVARSRSGQQLTIAFV